MVKKKDLIRQNEILKCFVSQMIEICRGNVMDVFATGGNLNKILMAEFVMTYQTHSFTKWFTKNYPEISNAMINNNIGDEFFSKYEEFFADEMVKNLKEHSKKRLEKLVEKDKTDIEQNIGDMYA